MTDEPHQSDARRLWPVALGLVLVTASFAGSIGYWFRPDRHGESAPAASRHIASASIAAALKRPLETSVPPPTIQRMTQDEALPPLPVETPATPATADAPAADAAAVAPAQAATPPAETAAATAPAPPATTGSVGGAESGAAPALTIENGAPMDCLPAHLRDALNAVRTAYGPVSVISTTTLNTGNHNKAREKLHHDCLAVDFKVDNADPKAVLTFLRQQPGMGGLGRYKNGVIHMDDASAHPPGAYDRD